MWSSLVFLLLFLIVLYLGYKIYGCSINPLLGIVGVFFIALVIYYSADFINHDLLRETKYIYMFSLTSFLIGILTSQLLQNRRVKIKGLVPEARSLRTNDSYEYKTHEKLVYIGFWITGIVCLVTIWVIVFEIGITVFLNDIFRTIKEAMASKRIYTLTEMLKKTLLVFSPLELDFALRYKEKRIKCFLFAIISLILSLSFSRVMFLYLLIVDFFAFYFNMEKKINIKSRIMIIAIVLGAIVFFNNTQELFNKVMQTTGSIAGYQLTNAQITILSYFFAPLKSSDMYVRMELESLPLAATFRYVYEIFNVDTLASVDVPFVYIPFSFNTAVAPYYLYREGGYVWLVLASFIYGIVSDAVFRDYLRNKTAGKLVTVCFLMLCLLMAIRSYMPMFLEFWIPLITLLVVRSKMKKARFKDNLKREREQKV